MQEYLIYRNGRLRCIVNEDKAEATLKLLQGSYPMDEFEMIEKPEGKIKKILEVKNEDF